MANAGVELVDCGCCLFVEVVHGQLLRLLEVCAGLNVSHIIFSKLNSENRALAQLLVHCVRMHHFPHLQLLLFFLVVGLVLEFCGVPLVQDAQKDRLQLHLLQLRSVFLGNLQTIDDPKHFLFPHQVRIQSLQLPGQLDWRLSLLILHLETRDALERDPLHELQVRSVDGHVQSRHARQGLVRNVGLLFYQKVHHSNLASVDCREQRSVSFTVLRL